MNLVFLHEKNETRFLLNEETIKLFLSLHFKAIFLKEKEVESSEIEKLSNAGLLIKHKLSFNKTDESNVFLKIHFTVDDLQWLPNNSLAIGLFDPFQNPNILNIAQEKKLRLLALDLMPRSTVAQSMDIISSQANLAGYQAVIEASYHCSKIMPLMMSPAGSIPPCRVLILGAGVAGLQAIATAKRLGAIVEAFDTRASAKENIESLGAAFISLGDIRSEENQDGYAKELKHDSQLKQQNTLIPYLKKSDIVITTAQVFGKKAPILITQDMLKHISQACVIVDLAAQSGGNVACTVKDEIVIKNSITIIGTSQLAKKIPSTATRVLSKNMLALFKEITKQTSASEPILFNEASTIFNSLLLTKKGRIVHPLFTKFNEENQVTTC